MQSKNQEMLFEDTIKNAFYLVLTESLIMKEGITINTIDKLIEVELQTCVHYILDLSESLEGGIRLFDRTEIYLSNCPNKYTEFLHAVLQIKKIPYSEREQPVNYLAKKISTVDSFKEMIEQVKIFILAAMDQLDYDGITPEVIRNTFYSEMKNQGDKAIQKGWITLDDLEMQDAYIYLAFPALALIEAMFRSKNCTGIILLHYKVLTTENCPQADNFPLLFKPLLENKKEMVEISEQELEIITQLCLTRADLEIPLNTLDETTQKHATKLAATINSVASQISQAPVFRQTIQSIIDACIEEQRPSFGMKF